jgi:hypothetical protein
VPERNPEALPEGVVIVDQYGSHHGVRIVRSVQLERQGDLSHFCNAPYAAAIADLAGARVLAQTQKG